MNVTREEFQHLQEFRHELYKVVSLITAGQLDPETLTEPLQALDTAWLALSPQIKDYIEVNVNAQRAGQ